MRIDFDTTPYRNSHGKQPRGEGCWAYLILPDRRPRFTTCCQYSEAKRQIREQCATMRLAYVIVAILP